MADTVVVSTKFCEPGMVLAADIINDFGAIILFKNSVLDDYSINRLKRLGVEFIRVYREYEAKEKKDIVIQAQYNNNVTEFKEVIWDISCGKSIDVQRVQDISRNLTSNFDSINDAVNCLNKVRAVDEYTYTHSVNVSILCSLLGKWLNLDSTSIKQITYCGLLHDIGKAKIPPHILNKPEALTPKEFEEIKKHPVLGYNLLENAVGLSKEIASGVLLHHEREDGSGYPFGLKAEKIPLYAKIVAIADVYDAMTSNRVYKKRQPPFDVLEMFESEYLTKCDTAIMITFLKHIASYYIGSRVKLNNGQKGEIIYINQNKISRPLIKLDNEDIIDLYFHPEIKIAEML